MKIMRAAQNRIINLQGISLFLVIEIIKLVERLPVDLIALDELV